MKTPPGSPAERRFLMSAVQSVPQPTKAAGKAQAQGRVVAVVSS
ncbi:hypothetical protein GGR25_002671 [Kaistia hirudinis]|uniref:Uncharacterized protein n=1 Tax=Kaistia hirudinis TaxID=1293440 RepID=A0A840AS17_9HYPH|nr:hypothetical protein [Kaistia hirudinis]